MSSVKLPDHIHKHLERISNENGFCDYSTAIESSTVSGYGSNMYNITISENNSDKKLKMLCKMAAINKNGPKDSLSEDLFKREAMFYDKIVPIFNQFQKEKNVPKDDHFSSFPKCYATVVDDEYEDYGIIMEDLRPQGFSVWDRPNSTPIDRLRVAIRALGKFHGISFAMKDQRPNEFAEFKELTDLLKSFMELETGQKFFNDAFDLTINSLKNDDYKNIIHDIKKRLPAYLDGCISNETTDRFGVISHGDFHNNNILCRLNGNGIAEDIRIVDWQLIRYVSPALDLLYMLFPSTEKQLRDHEFNNLIKQYHDSLSQTVRQLGSNPDKLFTLNDVYDELRRCGNFALITTPIMTFMYETNSLTKNKKYYEEVDTNMNDTEQLGFDQRTNEVIEDIVSFGCYQKLNRD